MRTEEGMMDELKYFLDHGTGIGDMELDEDGEEEEDAVL